jgi:predicted P-loop ATPase
LGKLGIQFSYDAFHDKMLVQGSAADIEVGESIDDTCLKVRAAAIATQQFDPGNDNTLHAVRFLCLANRFDPVCDYLEGLQHDGKSRLDTWLTTYLGAEDNALNRAIGRKTLVAAVRRARQPGCKFDTIMVLEGNQGSGKSSALKILAGNANFSDAEILSAKQQQQQELICGVWIYELSELAGLQKAAVEGIKLFASKTHDCARKSYGRARVDQPRRCILVGTTNDREYLQDPTGNRRFWPVATGKIDLDALERDRDQLWAEAAVAEAQGEPLTIDQSLWGVAAARQASRLVSHPWEDRLEGLERLAPQSSGSIMVVPGAPGEPDEIRVSSDYVLHNILSLQPGLTRTSHSRQLAAVLRRLGWTGPKKMRFGERSINGYSKPIFSAVPNGAKDVLD